MNPVAFTSKQKQMLNLPHKTWNIYTGAVRSGKSYGTMFLIPQRIGAHYTQPCLIVGKTLATVERNVLRPLRTIFGGYDVGDIKGRADGGRYVVLWGKEVDCVGANDERAISKIHGAEYVVALFPILILLSVISAFQQAIDQLMILLMTVAGSIIGKISLHFVTIGLEKSEMLKRAKDGEDK